MVCGKIKKESGIKKKESGIFFLMIFSVFLIPYSLFLIPVASAGPLSFVRDTIGTSAPSLPATHEVMFIVTNAIPAGGKIIITPRETGLIIPAGMNFLDADLAIATSTDYTDRNLAASPDVSNDGVSFVSGTGGSIIFTLNSSFGINAGEKVQIELGNNARFAATGTNFMINPTPVGSYRIDIQTQDASGVRIDSATAMIAIIEQVTAGPVNTTIGSPPVISNGLPAGLLPSGIQAVELSVQTDVPATCKYSTDPDVLFASSTGAFAFTGGAVHSGAVITGLVDGLAYNYYVRCQNYQLLANTTDYVIAFSIGVVPSTAPPAPPAPPPTPTVGVPGGGDFLKTSDVTISGKAYPSAKIYLLKDGKESVVISAASNGTWSAKLTGLERGTYTFGIYAIDSKSRKSATISSTVSVISGTGNTVTNIFLAPTVSAEKTSVDPGEPFILSGQGTPGSITELTFSKQASGAGDPIVATTTVDSNGLWNMDFPTKGLSKSGYEVKTRAIFTNGDGSGFGRLLSLGIGQDAAPDLAARSDMNNDGKVNIVDFSILLFSWGGNDANADINGNGKVDLADFSIMIFYWTG
jgi:hypothetical protein